MKYIYAFTHTKLVNGVSETNILFHLEENSKEHLITLGASYLGFKDGDSINVEFFEHNLSNCLDIGMYPTIRLSKINDLGFKESVVIRNIFSVDIEELNKWIDTGILKNEFKCLVQLILDINSLSKGSFLHKKDAKKLIKSCKMDLMKYMGEFNVEYSFLSKYDGIPNYKGMIWSVSVNDISVMN